jgi:hypothetical protein
MHQRPVASLTFFNQRKRRMVKGMYFGTVSPHILHFLTPSIVDAISISPKQEVVLGCKQLQQYAVLQPFERD